MKNKDARYKGAQTAGETRQENAPYYAKRNNSRKLRWIAWAVVMVPVVYFTVQIFMILTPRMRTELAIQETMTDYMRVTGNVMLQTQPVTGQGILYYTAQPGRRVSAGAEVARIFQSADGLKAMYELNRVSEQIALLEQAQKTSAEKGDVDLYLEQMQKAQQGYMYGLQLGDYSVLAEPANEMMLAGNKVLMATGGTAGFESQINELQGRKQQYEALAVSTGSITSPATGYFTPSTKQDRIPLDTEEVRAASAGELQQMLMQSPMFYGPEIAGHVISDYKWSYIFTVSIKEASRFSVGSTSLKIRFPGTSELSFPVKVSSVEMDEAAGLAKVELMCEYISPEILTLRVEQADIIFREFKGIRVDKSALRIVEGKQYVYVKFANQVYLTPIKILLEDEFYLLVSEEFIAGENELKLFDTVVVDSGGMELHDKRVL